MSELVLAEDREAVRVPTLNRPDELNALAWEAAGFRDPLHAGVEFGAEIVPARVPERAEFDRIAAERGLKAALAWRDSRYD